MKYLLLTICILATVACSCTRADDDAIDKATAPATANDSEQGSADDWQGSNAETKQNDTVIPLIMESLEASDRVMLQLKLEMELLQKAGSIPFKPEDAETLGLCELEPVTLDGEVRQFLWKLELDFAKETYQLAGTLTKDKSRIHITYIRRQGTTIYLSAPDQRDYRYSTRMRANSAAPLSECLEVSLEDAQFLMDEIDMLVSVGCISFRDFLSVQKDDEEYLTAEADDACGYRVYLASTEGLTNIQSITNDEGVPLFP